MQPRITWTMLLFAAVLIGIGRMHFSLTALQEPGLLETRIATLAKRFIVRGANRYGIPSPPVDKSRY